MSDDLFRGNILYAGIGNPLRGDDGVGCYIAEKLSALNAGGQPDMIYQAALEARPERVIIFDACDMGLEAGTTCMFSAEFIVDEAMSTHKIPLSLICGLISEDTGAEVYVAGIQPASTEAGTELTEAVRNAAEKIIGRFRCS